MGVIPGQILDFLFFQSLHIKTFDPAGFFTGGLRNLEVLRNSAQVNLHARLLELEPVAMRVDPVGDLLGLEVQNTVVILQPLDLVLADHRGVLDHFPDAFLVTPRLAVLFLQLFEDSLGAVGLFLLHPLLAEVRHVHLHAFEAVGCLVLRVGELLLEVRVFQMRVEQEVQLPGVEGGPVLVLQGKSRRLHFQSLHRFVVCFNGLHFDYKATYLVACSGLALLPGGRLGVY